jgi:hypothetical protein
VTRPIEPVRQPLVEPATPTRPVVRRREEAHDEQPRREREEQPRPDEDGDEPGFHVDVLA